MDSSENGLRRAFIDPHYRLLRTAGSLPPLQPLSHLWRSATPVIISQCITQLAGGSSFPRFCCERCPASTTCRTTRCGPKCNPSRKVLGSAPRTDRVRANAGRLPLRHRNTCVKVRHWSAALLLCGSLIKRSGWIIPSSGAIYGSDHMYFKTHRAGPLDRALVRRHMLELYVCRLRH